MFSSIKHHYEFHQSVYLNCIHYLLQLHISVYQWPEMELLAKTQQHSNLNLQLQSWIFFNFIGLRTISSLENILYDKNTEDTYCQFSNALKSNSHSVARIDQPRNSIGMTLIINI